MRLELGNIFIKDVQFGDVTKVEKGTLYVNKAELLEEISEISTTADDIVLMKSERISGRLTYTPI